MRVDVLSLFPTYFDSPFEVSLMKKAREKGLLDLNCVNIRNFAQGKHKQVDDRPYGGGPGMVLMPQPVVKAIRSVKKEDSHVIYLTPQGKKLKTKRCQELAKKSHLILLCGHYEGVDERVIELEIDEEISIGDYVLTSGSPAALVLIDAVMRFIPGVIGHQDAAKEDSFANEEGIFDAPHYTRPPNFEKKDVPLVLRQGDHAAIQRWRQEKARKKTRKVRPDLMKEDRLKGEIL